MRGKMITTKAAGKARRRVGLSNRVYGKMKRAAHRADRRSARQALKSGKEIKPLLLTERHTS